jgi:DNA repair exonuclease SbcCD ATPase subunit
MKLLSVQFQNFQLYGSIPTKVNLTSHGVTMINGVNGSGKTTILNAISYGLYDKSISDISKDGLINNINKKNMEVIVEFEKNNHRYKIRRFRKMKGNGVQLWEDDIEITPDSTSNTTSMIESILNMPHELFERVIVFSAINTQFLNLPMRQQADMLEELLDLKMLSEKAELLKETIKDTNRSIEIEDEHIVQSNNDCRKFSIQLKRAHERVEDWEKNHITEIQTTTALLNQLNIVDIEKEKQLQSDSISVNEKIDIIEDELTELSHQLQIETKNKKLFAEYQESEINWDSNQKKLIGESSSKLEKLKELDLEKQLKLHDECDVLDSTQNDLTTTKTDIISKIETLDNLVTENEKELKHLGDNNCPYCNQEFKDTKDKVKKCNDIINESKSLIDTLNKEIVILTKELKLCEVKSKKLKDQIELSRDEAVDISFQIVSLIEKIETYEHDTNLFTEKLQNFKQTYNPNIKKDVIQLIEKLAPQLQEQQTKIITIEEKRSLDDNAITQHNQQLAVLTSKLEDQQKEINNMIEPLKELEEEWVDEENEQTYVDLFKNLKLQTKYPDNLTELIDEDFVFITGTKRSDHLHKLSEHQKFLLKLLTNKNSFIRKSMLNQTIPFLNKRLDGYLKTMGLPHSVTFTPKMEIDIKMLGNTLQYGNLSNGQACRVNLALSFAFRDVLQYLHEPINVLILDEILDVGLDEEGVDNAVKMVKRKSIDEKTSIFVISHVSEIDNTFNNKIEIKIIDGFSTVV